MAVVREKLRCKHGALEFYSPPRVVKMARKLGTKGGVSLDLTVPANDGYIWDFNRKYCRERALQTIDEQRPLFLTLSPRCTPYSNIQYLNMRTPDGNAKVELARRREDVHLTQVLRDTGPEADGGTLCASTPSRLLHGATIVSTDSHRRLVS